MASLKMTILVRPLIEIDKFRLRNQNAFETSKSEAEPLFGYLHRYNAYRDTAKSRADVNSVRKSRVGTSCFNLVRNIHPTQNSYQLFAR